MGSGKLGRMGEVITISGSGRSGSTVLGCLLHNPPGTVFTGELGLLWESLLGNWRCGCGWPVLECAWWKRILDRLGRYGERSWVRELGAIERRLRGMHSRCSLGRRKGLTEGEWSMYGRATGRLVRGIFQVSGCRFIIDSTKYPAHVWALEQGYGNPGIVHLVRDSRSVVAAQVRSPLGRSVEENRGGGGGRVLRVARSAVAWDMRNWDTEGLKKPGRRYWRMRYEDFVGAPGREVARALEWVAEGMPVRPEGFPYHGRVPSEIHTVAGNPLRLSHGEIRLREAEGRGLSRSEEIVATTLTLPLLVRYGYVGSG